MAVPAAVGTWLAIGVAHHHPAPSRDRVTAPADRTAATSVPVGSLSPAGPRVRRDCGALTAALPGRLGTLRGRPVSGAAHRAAAWGSPAVVLRCGVTPPSRPITGLLTIDGVDWVAVPHDRGVRWTTVGRDVTVQVFVPKSYEGQGPLISRLSPAIIRSVPETSAGHP